jgi:hypothetical protein
VSQCSNCHTPLPVDGRFCSNCGAPSGELSHVCRPDPTDELKDRLSRTLAGRYEIISLLGRGGMAMVFLARDLVLEREVAIKVLPPGMANDPKLIPRFHQEAKTAARLDHPNIIPIYRVESEAGLNYFVMKYVNGRSLEQVLEAGPLPVAQARRVLREAALALGHAHQRRIVHRDVKPANIMLQADGGVVLTDFGISKAAQGGTGLTGAGAIIGTPHYMAPEQAKGLEVDGRADQYALAIVGHHMLTGKLPFDGTAHSILYKHVFEPLPPVLEVRPDTPRDLSRALERALLKEPEHRFPSMEDFASAIGGGAASTATMVATALKPPSGALQTASAAEKWGARRRSIVTAILVCLAGALAVSWFGYRRLSAGEVASTVWLADSLAVLPEPPQPAPTGPAPMDTASAPVAAAGPESPEDRAPPPPRPARKAYGTLTVSSEPWGTLYIDDVEIGPTPVADYRLVQGSHRLRIEQEGYQSTSETVVITGPGPMRRSYNLEPQ